MKNKDQKISKLVIHASTKKWGGGEAQEKQSSKLATDNIPHKTAQKLRSRKKYIIKVLEYPGDRA